MEISRAIEILRKFNKWRRDTEESQMPYPKPIGEAIDTVVKDYEQKLQYFGSTGNPWQYQNSTL